MTANKITFVINGNTYSISPDDPNALTSIASSDQAALLTLFESLKQQRASLELRANQRLAQSSTSSSAIAAASNNSSDNKSLAQSTKRERLGRGDAEALMAKLIMEEKAKQKQQPSPSSFYKWILGIAGLIIICIILF